MYIYNTYTLAYNAQIILSVGVYWELSALYCLVPKHTTVSWLWNAKCMRHLGFLKGDWRPISGIFS